MALKIDHVESEIIVPENNTHATPPSGTVVFYAKTDGRFYGKDDLGTEFPMSSPSEPVISDLGNVSGSVNLNWSGVDIFRVTLTGNATFTNSGAYDGQRCLLEIKQDGVGSHTVAFTSEVRFGTDITSFTASTAANALDRIGMFYHNSSATYDVVAMARGF